MAYKANRKTASGTMQATLNAAVNAAKPLFDPPKCVKMRDADRPFWDAIMVARARDEWTESDLITAAQLARCMSDIEKEALALETEGSVIENQRGTPVMNPRHSVLEQLSRRQMALMRTLQIGGTSAGVAKSVRINARDMERTARAVGAEDPAESEATLLA